MLKKEINAQIKRALSSKNQAIVLISGPSCSGKSTLAKEIEKQLGSTYKVTIISQNDYTKNILNIPKKQDGYQTESLQAFELQEFREDVHNLLSKGECHVPNYSEIDGVRFDKKRKIQKGDITVIEGLHTIAIFKGEYMDAIAIYVDAGDYLCKRRRMEKDMQHGVVQFKTLERWDKSIVPQTNKYVFPQKKFADIVVTEN